MATKTASKSALDRLAKQVGGVAQYDKGRVEYKVKGAGYKATRYVRPGEEANMDAPRANPRDPVSHETSGYTKGLKPAGSDITYEKGAQVPGGVNIPPPPTAPTAAAATPAATTPSTQTQAVSATAPVMTPAAAPTPTQNKYQAGLAAATASGVPAPTDAGQARAQMTRYTPNIPDTTAVDMVLSEDPAITTLMQGITQLLNPKNQTSTLMQDYKKLYKQSGLDDINEELIDAETVINGTEDDIRNEIQTAGGLGTESQVQALTLARNKGLLTRYNQLVQMKTDATNQLNTMMSLNQQDKQMAQTRIGQQIDAMFNMANFRQTALNNTRSQYQWLAQTMGADGLYNSLAGDPRQLAFAEQILGTGPGGLQQLAATAAQTRAREVQKENLQIEGLRSSLATDALQRSKIRAEIEKVQAETAGIGSKDQARLNEQVGKAQTVLGKIGEARSLIRGGTTGTIGGITKYVPGTESYALDKTVQTIRNVLSTTELQKMRDMSPTGGALGNVTERELELLGNQVASLDVGQNEEVLRNNIAQVETHYVNWMAVAAPERLGELGYSLTPTGEVVKIR